MLLEILSGRALWRSRSNSRDASQYMKYLIQKEDLFRDKKLPNIKSRYHYAQGTGLLMGSTTLFFKTVYISIYRIIYYQFTSFIVFTVREFLGPSLTGAYLEHNLSLAQYPELYP